MADWFSLLDMGHTISNAVSDVIQMQSPYTEHENTGLCACMDTRVCALIHENRSTHTHTHKDNYTSGTHFHISVNKLKRVSRRLSPCLT